MAETAPLITLGGMRMPKLGLGTWPMKGGECRDAVLGALAMGYRHIDTAEAYGNEDGVGAALAEGNVPRADLHVTSKVWWDHLDPGAMRDAMARSLDLLRTDYVDLYLVHWPAPGMDLASTLEALVRLREEGKARAIGVANFPLALLRQAVEEVRAPIACLQVEYHVMLGQRTLLEYTQAHDIALTAYSPVLRGKLDEAPALLRIADKHGATPVQVALAWLLAQDGVAAIPKAAGAANQRSNLDSQHLVLDDDDRAAIAALPKDRRLVNPGFAPAWDAPAA